ncbi:MAG: heme o synthase, partial [Bacteroidota bacterium]
MKTRAASQKIEFTKLQDLKMLVKLRLNLLVVFSSGIGYALAAGPTLDFVNLFLICLGGFLVTGSANALNQVLERDYDKLMPRTATRPIASGRMEVSEAVLYAGLMGVVGIMILGLFNPLTAMIGSISLFIYAFVYTPMKRVSSIAVLIGAFPGALPPLIGYVAFTGFIGPEALALFGIQFMWQFPHFWAIAWVSHDDYIKGGYFLLPSKGGQDKNSAMQCLIYALLLIPVSLFPYFLGTTGIVSAVIVG